MPPADGDVLTNVRLPRDLHAALQQRAAKEDRSMAATIRQACYHYLKCDQAPGGEAPGGEG